MCGSAGFLLRRVAVNSCWEDMIRELVAWLVFGEDVIVIIRFELIVLIVLIVVVEELK